MIPFVFDDGGKAETGSSKVKDCVVRALSIALEHGYAVTQELVGNENWRRLLRRLGWQWQDGPPVKLTNAELPPGRLIVQAEGHLVAVVDGTVHDTHDPNRDLPRVITGFYSKRS